MTHTSTAPWLLNADKGPGMWCGLGWGHAVLSFLSLNVNP